jgi:hypothetical protein
LVWYSQGVHPFTNEATTAITGANLIAYLAAHAAEHKVVDFDAIDATPAAVPAAAAGGKKGGDKVATKAADASDAKGQCFCLAVPQFHRTSVLSVHLFCLLLVLECL